MQNVDKPSLFYGSPEQQLQQIKEYLLRSNQQINSIFNNFAIQLNKQDKNKDNLNELLSNSKELNFKDFSVSNIYIKNSIETINKGKRYFGKTAEILIGDKYLCFVNGLFVGTKAKES